MTEGTRAFLAQLDELLLQNDDTSKEVLAVLTALRSHDVRGNTSFKQITTVPIRRAAFPKCAEKFGDKKVPDRLRAGDQGSHMSFLLEDDLDGQRVDLRGIRYEWNARKSITVDADRHFGTHADEAARVLGLRVVK